MVAYLGTFIDHVERLNKLDVDELPSFSQVIDTTMQLRSDKLNQQDTAIAENAPRFEDHCFRVPRILES